MIKSTTQFLRKSLGFLLISVWMLTTGYAQKHHTLSLNLKKGQVFNTKVLVEQTISQSAMGMDQQFGQDIGFYYEMKVNDIVQGNYDMTITYTRATFKTDNPMGSVDYDSNNADEEVAPMALGYAAVVGLDFGIVMNKQGKVLEVNGAEEFLTGVEENIMKLNPALGPQIAAAAKEQFGASSLKQSLENMTAYYPEDPVKMGDSWDSDFSVKQGQGFEMMLKNTYTLDRVEGGKYYLKVVSEIKTDKDAVMEMQGMKMTYDLGGEQAGEIILDQATGWAIESGIDQEINGNMTIDSPQFPNPMDVPMGIVTSTTITWIK